MSKSGYTVLANAVEAVTVEKNSDFLTFLHPVNTRAEAITWIDFYREKYPDANHVCWAYIIGNTRQPQTQAFSDDGEPSGTAGKPILHVLTEREVGNAVAVVVRYFGGVKLGAGGLVRAYSNVVSAAINAADLVTVTPKINLTVITDFAREAKIRHLVSNFNGEILSAQYGTEAILVVSVAEAERQNFSQQIINETSGSAKIIRAD